MPGPTTLNTIDVGGAPEPWRELGLEVGAEGLISFRSGSIRIVDAEPGIVGWSLSGVDADLTAIDGLPTRAAEPGASTAVEHPNGAYEIDHVVVLTGSLDRTCGALAEATGEPLKRVREVGTMRQGFHRLGRGGVVVEVIERPEFTAPAAAFWGLVLNVGDLDAALALLGSGRVGRAKDAVQPGRRIATIRAEVGLGLPVALMSPVARREEGERPR